jgi:Leucine-rich repeat (LRR) protein
VREIDPLDQLVELEDLDISNTPVDDLSALADLQNLKSLNCSGTQVDRLDRLEDLTSLESLDCSNTRVRRLDAVSRLSLKTLKCYNTGISEKRVEDFASKNPECNVVYYR